MTSYKDDLEKAASENCVNNPYEDDKCQHDRDRRHFALGANWTLKRLSEGGEFREFWLDDRSDDYSDDQWFASESEQYDTDIHVIDIQALAASEAKRTIAEDVIKQCGDKIRALEAQLAKCKEQRDSENKLRLSIEYKKDTDMAIACRKSCKNIYNKELESLGV